MKRISAPAHNWNARIGFLGTILCWAAYLPAYGTEPPTPSSDEQINEPELTSSDLEHWAWSPLDSPPLPKWSAPNGNPQSPIDLFIGEQLNKHQLRIAPIAPKATLLRRLKFDLHGLPPSPAELNAFISDTRPDAYERLVDQLLTAPEYGQRWAQYWLDLARFAETDGFEHDKIRPDAWRYRDWVIHSLNADMSYEQFVRLQLAGDLSGNPQDAIATMFCMAGPDMPDINEQDLRRHDKLNELTSTVGSTLLAMQLQCAQCHDHKYDPISQADFYRFRAIFESAVPTMVRDRPVNYLAPNEANGHQGHFYRRGELKDRGPIVPAAIPRVAALAASGENSSYLQLSETPRIQLTEWLFQPDNPLTARVIANRVWQFHFGKSLAENPSDFGVVAGEPSHPDLLDWLACELRDNDWSLKHLHRTILLSATYRQSSSVVSFNEQPADMANRIETDPENALYSRFPRKRLEGEVVRDAMLTLCGTLNREFDGPGVRPPLPDELTGTLLKGQWKESDNLADHYRRSIYVFARRNLRYPIFDVFDRPDAGVSCAIRGKSTTALQSLQMLNSQLSLDTAARVRDQILQNKQFATHSSAEVIDQLFVLTLGRQATIEEHRSLDQLLDRQNSAADESEDDPLLLICLALLNTNEFIYVD